MVKEEKLGPFGPYGIILPKGYLEPLFIPLYDIFL